MIILYDIPSVLEQKAWSPSTFKTRFCLNFKKIPYKTEWVEFPDITKVLKEIGGSPTAKDADGSDRYTLPAIRDLNTGAVVTDSMTIAQYLDSTYSAPQYPAVFPSFNTPGVPSTPFVTYMAITAFSQILSLHGRAIMKITFPAGNSILHPVSEAHNRAGKEKLLSEMYGKPTKLEDLSPPGAIRDAVWTEVHIGLKKIFQLMDKNSDQVDQGKEKMNYYFGETPSYADICLLASLVHIKSVLKENEEWKMMVEWSGGRFDRLLNATRGWQAIL